MKKANKTKKQIFFIFIGVFVVGLIFLAMFTYSYINNIDAIVLGVSESYELSTTVSDNTKVLYNSDIISYDNNRFTAIANGESTVCVTHSFFDRDFFKFVVIPAPTKIDFSATDTTICVGETINAQGKCIVDEHNFDLDYVSSNEGVAIVDSNKLITAVGTGECVITATAYNGISENCKITVLNPPTDILLDTQQLTMYSSDSYTINYSFLDGEYCSSVDFISSDNNVASIKNNCITANSPGECTISVNTIGNISKKISVTVIDMPQSLSLLLLDTYCVGTSFELITDLSDVNPLPDMQIDVSDTSIIKQNPDDKFLFDCLKTGTATITVTLQNGVSAQKEITVKKLNSNTISFSVLNQYPTLPTGCEVVSLTSVLRHLGFDVSMTTLADKYMPRYSGSYYDVSPNDYYLGNPYDETGFGCFAPCIVKTAENFFCDYDTKNQYVAIDITGCNTDNIYNYISSGVPVITWVTSGFWETKVNGTWQVNGETITWMEYEHCLVTTGYNKNNGTVTVSDVCGGYSYTVSMSKYERIFEDMGSRAVVILKK